jgi:RNA polymerase sigma-70 factor (ECF subfamily)
MMSNDQILIERVRSGDELAFQQLFDKYWQDLYRIAYQRVKSAADAQDLVQEVFISFWNNIHHVKTGDAIAGYLFIALRNKVFDFYEKQQVRLHYIMEQPFRPADTPEQPFENITNKELRNIVAAAVESLPGKMKEIYQLSREQHLTVAEIADLLALSPQTVKNQLTTALQRIRKDVQRYRLLLML